METENLKDFKTDLSFSKDPKIDAEIEDIIRRTLKVDQIIDISDTRLGMKFDLDKLCLRNGQSFLVEVKTRRSEWSDVLLETSSSEEDNKPGWLFTSRCEYLLYTFRTPYRVKYVLFDFQKLTEWWEQNKRKSWPIKPSKNRGYTTISVAIPLKELKEAILTETVSQLCISDFTDREVA